MICNHHRIKPTWKDQKRIENCWIGPRFEEKKCPDCGEIIEVRVA